MRRFAAERPFPSDFRRGPFVKTISFALPCYNSAEYMDKCVESILAFCDDREDIEILIVNDGSTKDDTRQKADEWQTRHPQIIRAIHKENGGHGSAVNTGISHARGFYYKVVDSDDWLDEASMRTIMPYLREQVVRAENATDMVVANYVYEKVFEGKHTVMDYANVFPEGREFGWDEVGRFKSSQYLLMHSVIYRTQMLRDIELVLPEHCFYVDNIFVYVPLPHVHSIRYFNVDMYRYFIGREGQSVNEDVMKSRIDQHLRVTRLMVDQVDIDRVDSPRLRAYLDSYLAMMMCICAVFLRMIDTPESNGKLADTWGYLKERRPKVYGRLRRNPLNVGMNLPGSLGRGIGLGGYRLARKVFKFN